MGIATILAARIRRNLAEVIERFCLTCGGPTSNSSGVCDDCA